MSISTKNYCSNDSVTIQEMKEIRSGESSQHRKENRLLFRCGWRMRRVSVRTITGEQANPSISHDDKNLVVCVVWIISLCTDVLPDAHRLAILELIWSREQSTHQLKYVHPGSSCLSQITSLTWKRRVVISRTVAQGAWLLGGSMEL